MTLLRKKGLISYYDIGQYQRCPLLFTKFQTPKTEIEYSPHTAAKRLVVDRMLLKIFELQYMPSTGTMGMVLKSEYKTMMASGDFTRSELNNISLYMSDMLSAYHKAIHSNYLRIIAKGFKTFISYGSLTFEETVSVLLMDRDKNIIPMIELEPDVKAIRKDNRIRFICAALSIMSGTQITKYVTYGIGNTAFVVNNLSSEELDRAKKELINIMKQMNDTQHTPNTHYCNKCVVSNRCRL